MTGAVLGIKLPAFEDPIRDALKTYSEITDGKVEFEYDHAGRLERTPEKHTYARSATIVRHAGEIVSTLYVVVFAPKDGTGDESAYQINKTNMGSFEHSTKVLPRSKRATHSEAHLTLVAQDINRPNANPIQYAGSFDLLSLNKQGVVTKIAELGQSRQAFAKIITGRQDPWPTTTLTVGYRGAMNDLIGGERFGDPHAVLSPWRDVVQVCGFLAVAKEQAGRHLDMMRELHARDPALGDYPNR